MKNAMLLACLCVCCLCTFAQKKSVKGKVSDNTGAPIASATITIEGSDRATVSGRDGSFEIQVSPGERLVISAVGYAEQIVTPGEGNLNIRMLQGGSKELEEVVVTALGVRKEKRNLTYSTQEVKGDELLKAKEPNIVNAMAGKVSGVQITSSSGTPGSSSRIVIRGASSVFGDNQALIVLDGVPINNDETGNLSSGPGTNRLADIDPAIIESINVLKGAAATTLYGSSGARGVIMITTKNGKEGRKPALTFSQDFSFEKPLLPEIQTKYGQGEAGVYFDGETQKTSAVWGPLMDTLRINGQPARKYSPTDEFFRTGVTSNSTVSVEGGGASFRLLPLLFLPYTGWNGARHGL